MGIKKLVTIIITIIITIIFEGFFRFFSYCLRQVRQVPSFISTD